VHLPISWEVTGGERVRYWLGQIYDKAECEQVKRRSGGIENWIEEQPKHT
jgi:hypothetical protein